MIKEKDLLGLRNISTDEIDAILRMSIPMKDIIKRDIEQIHYKRMQYAGIIAHPCNIIQ